MNIHRTIALLGLLAISSANAASPDGTLLEQTACTLPAYADLPRIKTYASLAEYTQAVADSRFVCEKLQYSSDGLAVVAYLYRPAKTDNQKLPVIIFNRGSYVVKDQGPLLLAMFHRLAQEGFIVIAPMYRGSEGAPGHDEMGGADLADLKNVLPLARQFGFADLENVFLYGASRGGIMTFLALRDGFPARAAATFGGLTDLGEYLKTDPQASQIAHAVWPDYDQRKEQIHSTRSAIQWAEKIDAPLLLMHGGADAQVNPVQTLNLAMRFQQLKKKYGLLIFAGDNHTISQHRVERDRDAARWFKEHLK